MPYTVPSLAVAAKASIDYHMKNKPIDQIVQERPLLKMLMAGRKPYAGALQYVTEQLISNYGDDDGQWVKDDDTLDFNSINPNEQAKYLWSTRRRGLGVSEDECTQNGIILTDDSTARATDAERIALANLLETKTYALTEGMQKGLDFDLHLDGTQSAKALPGLDALVSLTPATGVVGGIDRATNPWWRNYAKTGIAAADIVAELEIADRETRKHGAAARRKIIAGAAWIDNYRKQAKDEIQRHIVVQQRGGTGLDAATPGLYFANIEIEWDPTFEDLDAALNPTIPWTKRAYIINQDHYRLRPIQGHDFVLQRVTRPYDKYVHYWDYKFKGSNTMSRGNAHAGLAIA